MYLAWRAEQLEDNEFKAEPLTEVLSVNDAAGEGEDVRFAMVQGGSLRLKKTRSSVPMPTGPEELRARYRVMWTQWEVTRLRFPERESLRGMGRDALERVLDYILGKDVGAYRTQKNTRLSWADLLEYELEIRKHACKRVNQGKASMADALRDAIRDNELRTKFFVAPLALAGARGRSRTPRRETKEDTTTMQIGKKGKGDKGRGKGKGDRNKDPQKEGHNDDWNRLVNQSRQKEKLAFGQKKAGKYVAKCIRFNKGACTESNCRYDHTCLRCGGARPLPECDQPPVSK